VTGQLHDSVEQFLAIKLGHGWTRRMRLMPTGRSATVAQWVATGYGLGDRGVGVRVQVGSRLSCSRSGAHPAFYPMDIGRKEAGA
jgi:hypothetical protein